MATMCAVVIRGLPGLVVAGLGAMNADGPMGVALIAGECAYHAYDKDLEGNED